MMVRTLALKKNIEKVEPDRSISLVSLSTGAISCLFSLQIPLSFFLEDSLKFVEVLTPRVS